MIEYIFYGYVSLIIIKAIITLHDSYIVADLYTNTDGYDKSDILWLFVVSYTISLIILPITVVFLLFKEKWRFFFVAKRQDIVDTIENI